MHKTTSGCPYNCNAGNTIDVYILSMYPEVQNVVYFALPQAFSRYMYTVVGNWGKCTRGHLNEFQQLTVQSILQKQNTHP